MTTSCLKSTKGKMANDWKVMEMIQQTTRVIDNEKTIEAISASEAIYVHNIKTILNGENQSDITKKGKVISHVYSIQKNGDWDSKLVFELSEVDQTGIKTVALCTVKENGTWNFVGKNKTDEFKLNERVLFNVLSSKQDIQVTVTAGSIVTKSSTNSFETHKVGEKVNIYTVVESKSKALTLESTTDSFSTEEKNGYNYIVSEQGTKTLVLEEGGE